MQNVNTFSANRRLAGLLGWTDIVEVDGALLGSPPAGAPECRGQAQVPDWAGDWRHAGPLSSAHGISTIYQGGMIEAQWDGPHFRHGLCCVMVRQHEGIDAAARFAIVDAAADKLEAGR